MSQGKHVGGVTKIFFGTTPGLSTSTQITGLWTGTQPGEAEETSGQDSVGRTIQTGIRLPGNIFSTALTAAFVSTLIGHADNCQELYIKYYYSDGNAHVYGPHTVRVGFTGAGVGEVHRVAIRHDGFTASLLQQVSFS